MNKKIYIPTFSFVTKMAFKIKFEKEKCIGCGSCAATCPDNWEIVEGKAHPKKTTLKEVGCNKEAEEICPVNCIYVEKE